MTSGIVMLPVNPGGDNLGTWHVQSIRSAIQLFTAFTIFGSMIMTVRGIRGAINVPEDKPEEILSATKELLTEVLRLNKIVKYDDIASIFFTTTPDLVSTFPAEAARTLGMVHVPLLCASEIAVPNRMPLCVRVLLHVNTEVPQQDIIHVYLRDAKKLRPDVQSAQ